MTGDTNNLEIWAPLVDNLLSILNALQIDLLVIGAKGNTDSRVIVFEVFRTKHGYDRRLGRVTEDVVVALDLYPSLETSRIPLLLDSLLRAFR